MTQKLAIFYRPSGLDLSAEDKVTFAALQKIKDQHYDVGIYAVYPVKSDFDIICQQLEKPVFDGVFLYGEGEYINLLTHESSLFNSSPKLKNTQFMQSATESLGVDPVNVLFVLNHVTACAGETFENALANTCTSAEASTYIKTFCHNKKAGKRHLVAH